MSSKSYLEYCALPVLPVFHYLLLCRIISFEALRLRVKLRWKFYQYKKGKEAL